MNDSTHSCRNVQEIKLLINLSPLGALSGGSAGLRQLGSPAVCLAFVSCELRLSGCGVSGYGRLVTGLILAAARVPLSLDWNNQSPLKGHRSRARPATETDEVGQRLNGSA